MKLTTLFLSLTIVTLLCSPLFAKKLTLGYFEAPPYVITNKDESKPSGVVIEMWELIAKEMGSSIVWQQMSIARIMFELQHGRLEGSSLFVPTPEREKNFVFSKNQWGVVQPGIAVRKDSPLKELKDPKDLKGLSIGHSSKSVLTPWFRDQNLNLKKIGGNKFVERLLKQLLLGRIDAVYWPSITGLKILIKELGGTDKVRFLASPLDPSPFKPMFPKTKKGRETAERFDRAFVKVQRTFDFQKVKMDYLVGKKK